MKTNTVVQAARVLQYNPNTNSMVSVALPGMLQEYSMGKPIGAPFPERQLGNVPHDNRGNPSSATRPQEGYATATISSAGTSQEDYYRGYKLPNETPEQTYMRNEANAARMQLVPGTNRAVATTQANGQPYSPGTGGY